MTVHCMYSGQALIVSIFLDREKKLGRSVFFSCSMHDTRCKQCCAISVYCTTDVKTCYIPIIWNHLNLRLLNFVMGRKNDSWIQNRSKYIYFITICVDILISWFDTTQEHHENIWILRIMMHSQKYMFGIHFR